MAEETHIVIKYLEWTVNNVRECVTASVSQMEDVFGVSLIIDMLMILTKMLDFGWHKYQKAQYVEFHMGAVGNSVSVHVPIDACRNYGRLFKKGCS